MPSGLQVPNADRIPSTEGLLQHRGHKAQQQKPNGLPENILGAQQGRNPWTRLIVTEQCSASTTELKHQKQKVSGSSSKGGQANNPKQTYQETSLSHMASYCLFFSSSTKATGYYFSE